MRAAMSLSRAFVALAFGGGLLFEARAASACSFDGRSSRALLLPEAKVPSNVRGIPFRYGEDVADGGPPARLLDASGVAIPTTIDPPLAKADGSEHLLVPLSPLSPGAYSVEVSGSQTATPVPFTVTPAAPVPIARLDASASTAQVESVGLLRIGQTGPAGGCYASILSAVVDVTLTVAEDYRPYRSVARFVVTPPLGTELGEQRERIIALPERDVPESLTSTYRIAHICDGHALSTKASVSVRIYGLDDARAEKVLDLDFPACTQPLPSTAGDGGSIGWDAAIPAEDSGGCSTASRASGASAAMVILAAASLAARRRRAVRRT